MATNVKILLRRGTRSEISGDTLSAGELGYTTDTNQLYVGTAASVEEIIFDPFANAHSVVQTYLNTYSTQPGLEIDEDLVISNINPVSVTAGAFVVDTVYTITSVGTTDFTLIGASANTVGIVFTATGVGTGTGTATYSGVDALISDMQTSGTFNVNIFGRAKKNVEVLTEKSFSQLYANVKLESNSSASGLRSDLYKKELGLTPVTAGAFVVGTEYKILTVGTTDFTLIGSADSNVGTVFTATGVGAGNGTAGYGAGTFLKYAKTDSTSFFIDYSLKQVGSSPAITFVRVGRLQVINGAAITPAIAQAKLTDTNTEIWQDDGDSIAQSDEFSNIVFTAVIDGDNLKINYTQDVNFTTEISYTVKRWTM